MRMVAFRVIREQCRFFGYTDQISTAPGNPPHKKSAIRSRIFYLRHRKLCMKTSRFTDSQIIAILKQAEAGSFVPELCREHGISNATFHK